MPVGDYLRSLRPPAPGGGLGSFLSRTRPRTSFYDLPQARSMREMGGIDPDEVDVERANEEARRGSLARRAQDVLAEGVNVSPGVAFTRNALSSGAGIVSGALEYADQAGELARKGIDPLIPDFLRNPVDPETGEERRWRPLETAADALDEASQQLLPEQDRGSAVQRFLTNPGRFAAATVGQAAPYMATHPALMTAGIMGSEAKRLEAEGVEPGLKRLGVAAASGGAQALMERIPVAKALQGIAGTTGRRALRGMAMEAPMEALQELPGVAADLTLGLREGESWEDIIKGTAGKMGEAFLSALGPGAILGVAAPNQIREPQTALQRGLAWFARERERRALRKLPEQQAAQDAARVERRRAADQKARDEMIDQFANETERMAGREAADKVRAAAKAVEAEKLGDVIEDQKRQVEEREQAERPPLRTAEWTGNTQEDRHNFRTLWKESTLEVEGLEFGKAQATRKKREGGTDIRVEMPVRYGDERFVITAHNDREEFAFNKPPGKSTANWSVEHVTTTPDGRQERKPLITLLTQREAKGWLARNISEDGKRQPAPPAPAPAAQGEEGSVRIPFTERQKSRREIRSWINRTFKPNRGLPTTLAETEKRSIARQEAALLEIEEGFKGLARAIQGHNYDPNVPGLKNETQLVRFLDDAFRGLVSMKTVQKYAPEAAPILERLMLQRDAFARDLRKRDKAGKGATGISQEISDDLARTFGLYVNRTYQAKFDAGWQERMQQEHPESFKRGLELWVHQALDAPTKRLMELNPQMSATAARAHVMQTWERKWAAGKFSPESRRITLPVSGVQKVSIEPGHKAEVQLGEVLTHIDPDTDQKRYGRAEFVDPESGFVTMVFKDPAGGEDIVEDIPHEELERNVRTSVVVDNPKQVEGAFLAALRWSNKGGSVLPGAALEAARNLNTKKARDRKYPDWQRLLMGEVRDVRTNYLGTMAQMVHLAETDRFLNEIADAGKAAGVFFPQEEGEATERLDPDLFGMGKVEGLEQAQIANQLLEANQELPPDVREGLIAIAKGVKGGPAYHPRTDPLGQLYATKELADALRNEVKGPGRWDWVLGLTHMARANQTVYSIQSSNRNYISNAFYLAANGWNPLAVIGMDRIAKGVAAHQVAYSRVLNDLYNLNMDAHTAARALKEPKILDEMLTKKLAEYVRLGIAHQSTDLGDLHRLARHAYRMKRLEDKPSAYKHAKEAAVDLYMAHDDFAKITAFEKELAVLNEAYPHLRAIPDMTDEVIGAEMEKLQLEGRLGRPRTPSMSVESQQPGHWRQPWESVTRTNPGGKGTYQYFPNAAFNSPARAVGEEMIRDQALKDMAAKKVRRTMQNYQELPEFAKMLSANPFVAPFMSFRISLVRNAWNIYTLSREEMASDNAVIKARGKARLGSFVATLAAPFAMVQTLQGLTDTDDDELEALRKIGYPWSQNASLAVVDRDRAKGTISYFDYGHLEVWDDLREPLIGALRSGDVSDRAKNAFYSVLKNFAPIDEEVFAGAVFDIMRNRKRSGGEVWNKQDHPLAKGGKIAGHLLRTIGPGTLRSLQKLYYASAGRKDPGGRDYVLWQELVALGGPRVVTLDLRDRLGDHANEWSASRREGGEILGRTKRVEDVAAQGDRSQAAQERAVDNFMDKVRAYRTLGLSEDQVRQVLTDRDVGAGLARSFARLDRQGVLRIINSGLEGRERRMFRELSRDEE